MMYRAYIAQAALQQSVSGKEHQKIKGLQSHGQELGHSKWGVLAKQRDYPLFLFRKCSIASAIMMLYSKSWLCFPARQKYFPKALRENQLKIKFHIYKAKSTQHKLNTHYRNQSWWTHQAFAPTRKNRRQFHGKDAQVLPLATQLS